MTCVRHADNIVINGFENHTICLSHLIPLHKCYADVSSGAGKSHKLLLPIPFCLPNFQYGCHVLCSPKILHDYIGKNNVVKL